MQTAKSFRTVEKQLRSKRTNGRKSPIISADPTDNICHDLGEVVGFFGLTKPVKACH